MQGVQKLKCTSCGTMFMSETGANICPTCSEQSHSHSEHESNGMSGCGCGHSHWPFLLCNYQIGIEKDGILRMTNR